MYKLALSKEQIAENIRELVLGKSRTMVHQDTGVPYRTLDSYLSGSTEPKLSNALLIAKALDTTVEYMALREGPETLKDLKGEKPATKETKSSARKQSSHYKLTYAIEAETTFNQLMSEFRRRITPQGLRLSDLKVHIVESDDCAPFTAGDLLMFDPTSSKPINGQKFIFEYMNTLLIRETQLVPGKGWMLKTNNDRFEDQLLDLSEEGDLAIKGRIVSCLNFF